MSKTILLGLIAIVAFSINSVNAQEKMTKMDSVSYSTGVMLANTLKQKSLDGLDFEMMMQGMKAALAGEAVVGDRAAMQVVNQYIQQQREVEMVKNLEEGKQFLAENGQKEGVVTLESGLQYKILQEGTGPKPASTNRVTVHYHGQLLDGTVFDSSVNRGEPATFGVTQVISGWVEALQLMPQGSKWRLFIPPNLAYGSRGAGADIKPNSTLIFDVELLEIK